MDSILVISYSYTGNSRRVAELLAAQHGWPHGQVNETHPRSGASGTWRCLLDSLLHRKPAVTYQGPEPSDFRIVVLVSPIWAYRLAGPMRTFVAERNEELHRVAVVTTMGSSGALNAVSEIGHLLGHGPVLAAAFTAREIEDGSCAPRLQAFGDALQPGSAAAEPVRPAFLSPSAV